MTAIWNFRTHMQTRIFAAMTCWPAADSSCPLASIIHQCAFSVGNGIRRISSEGGRAMRTYVGGGEKGCRTPVTELRGNYWHRWKHNPDELGKP